MTSLFRLFRRTRPPDTVLVNANILSDMQGQLAAIDKSQAVIEFELDGTILTANENFLKTVGYSLEAVRGQHHRIFVPAAEHASSEYREFWERLRRGEYAAGQYVRVARDGREVWLQATYNPILDSSGKATKVVKYCVDITQQKTSSANYEGQIAAISKSQAVIEFELDGTIKHANENFLKTVGYTLADIRGRHHRMFVPAAYAQSAEYHAFWAKLGRGEYDAGLYERVAKGDREVWLQASYNPIVDARGRPVKVVKYATDVTAQKRMTEQLSKLVTHLRGATAEVQASAEGISAGNTSLSQRVEEQAANLEQTAASMEEMMASVKQNAQNTVRANELAVVAREQADRGGTVVGQAVAAMRDINDASTKIADIVGLIDDIAFQTNLLALNAAVEAARAGEQGRGFAVVASEVRSLAGRSASAAKEIKSLIKDSVAKVADGSRLVEQSGDSLAQIVNSVKSVTEIVAEISLATQEQASGIEQVGHAIAQMDQATQQNAALVEEAAAASASIFQQARELNEAVAEVDGGESKPLKAVDQVTRPARRVA